VFITVSAFHPSVIRGKVAALRVESLNWLVCNVRTRVRKLIMINTLAYCHTELITHVKKFKVNVMKLFWSTYAKS
jgi:hypothetical protein